jgi:hypothetical protein
MTPWALVLAVAMTLEGEAGVLGAPGMHLVADSMLARIESPQHPDQWEDVLAAYYGSAPPSSSALAVAYAAVTRPWPSRGMPYAVSREDAERLGLRVDEWHCRDGQCIGLAREWERRQPSEHG